MLKENELMLDSENDRSKERVITYIGTEMLGESKLKRYIMREFLIDLWCSIFHLDMSSKCIQKYLLHYFILCMYIQDYKFWNR